MVAIIQDTSEVSENELIEQQLAESVQVFPDAITGRGVGASSFGVRSMFERKALLGVRGSYNRLERQYAWYHHEDNAMFRSIISGLAKRVQSLPYEIKSPEEDEKKWDDLIRFANFDNWESFVSQLIINYSVFDTGAFVEIIAPGHPLKEPTGAATGVAILDSRRCYPTGDPIYPVVYVNDAGRQHIMHRSRIVQFVDMTERNDALPGWGDSALSRCITAEFREILMAQYMRASLDDMPAPGFVVAKNLTEQKVLAQTEKMTKNRENDQDMFGRVVFLFGADTAQTPSLEFIQFAKEFAGFDPDKLSAMNAKYMAAGIGVDIQDFWELSGKGIGTATQSQVLADKSKGRALGRLIKGIERMINDVFPDDAEFTIKYRNEEEDLERAQTAQAWTTAIALLEPYTTKDEQRIMAANQVPAMQDAITDDKGNVIRFNDADPQTLEQTISVDGIPVLMGQSTDSEQPINSAPPVSGESASTLSKLIIDQMNASMIDVFTAATMLGQNPAEELRGMYWVGNQLVPKSQLQNIWKYGTLIAPSTTNADIIVQDEPEVLTTDAESSGVVATPPAPSPAATPAQPTAESAPDDNLIVGEEKDYRRTAARFKLAFNDVTMRLKNGQFSPGAATVLLLNALRKDGEEAYLDGLKRAGRKKPEIDDAGKKTLSQWLAQQRKMVKSFVSDVESGRYTDKVLSSKGAQWANGSLSDMLYEGMAAGDARKMWRWVTNFLKENCASCLALHGQVHQMKTYSSRKLVPQSVRLLCHGDNCGCKLVADDGPARGRIRSVRYVRRAFSKGQLN